MRAAYIENLRKSIINQANYKNSTKIFFFLLGNELCTLCPRCLQTLTCNHSESAHQTTTAEGSKQETIPDGMA